jgi:hypothetical protein
MAEKQQPQQPVQKKPDPRAEQWAEENKWFGQDEAMTFTALAHHKKLLREGYDPKSDEYYEEINSYIRDQFPNKFEQKEQVKEKAPQTVAGTSRTSKTSGSRKVKLTPSQVAIAKKLGLTLEQYAKYV